MAERDYALIFALDKYGDTEKWRTLKGAINDADRFNRWLLGPAAVPKTHIIEEVGDDSGTRPQLSDLMAKVMDLLRAQPSGARIGRRLYIFLAGHGVEAIDQARLETLLVTAESRDNWVQGFPGNLAMSHFRLEARFEEIILFMDCCRTMSAEARPSWNIPTTPDALAKSVRWGSALAAQLFTDVRERKVSGKMQGIFTSALMDGLEGKAKDGEGRITTESLSSYLYETLKGEERPDIHFPFSITFIDGKGANGGNSAVLTLPELPAGMTLVIRHGKTFEQVPADPKPQALGGLSVMLPAFGTYLVELLNDNGSVHRQVPVVLKSDSVHVTF